MTTGEEATAQAHTGQQGAARCTPILLSSFAEGHIPGTQSSTFEHSTKKRMLASEHVHVCMLLTNNGVGSSVPLTFSPHFWMTNPRRLTMVTNVTGLPAGVHLWLASSTCPSGSTSLCSLDLRSAFRRRLAPSALHTR